jgi:magnesium chelatase family protein
VRAALQNSGFDFPSKRITVNLAPADLPKESGRFDLAIALGILIASAQIKAPTLDNHEFAGELSLSGELRPVRGTLAMCLSASGAGRAFVLPQASADEAALVSAATILPARGLLDVCAHLTGTAPLVPHRSAVSQRLTFIPDLTEVKGQLPAKRALEVAAAGQHSLLMSGPPGSGKSMLAQRLPGLLPPMTDQEALESAAVHSLAGGFDVARWGQRSFQAPHHTSSSAALVGGGGVPRPGEISLAHHGVLFLDELPEFERRVLEALREPLETGHIRVSRAARRAEFPARFQLVAAMNPCPCGYLGEARCRCTPDQIARYRSKLSGPLLDRIDLLIEVPAVTETELTTRGEGESSAVVRERVTAARERQLARQGKPNALLTPDEVDQHCLPDCAGAALLKQAMTRLDLSARAYHRILKVARTIADLTGDFIIRGPHVAEAIQYRRGFGG